MFPHPRPELHQRPVGFSRLRRASGHGSPRGGALQCLLDGGFCRGTGRRARQIAEELERRQRAAVERSGEGGAAGIGDLGVAELEPLELRQHPSRRRQCTCRRWRRRHEGGEALVAERVAAETELLQRGPPPQGRREGHQPRVADGGVGQPERGFGLDLEVVGTVAKERVVARGLVEKDYDEPGYQVSGGGTMYGRVCVCVCMCVCVRLVYTVILRRTS